MVTVTNTKISELDKITTITDNPATADEADATEVFTIEPSGSEFKMLVEIENGPTNGTVTYSVAAGDFWASKNALTGSVAQGTKRGIVLEGAKYRNKDGEIKITFTPAEGKKLKTDHALTVRVIEMP